MLLLTGSLSPALSAERPARQKQSIPRLEQQRDAIQAELDQLAVLSLRSGVGTIGFRSIAYPDPDHTEWIQIDLAAQTTLDQVVLVPTIWRNAQSGFQADGFPLEFQLLAGLDSDTNGTVLATFTERDQLLPRIAPLVIACQGTVASWVRLNITKLSERRFDGKYNVELAEIMVFSGSENVALHQPVTALHSEEAAARHRDFLTDGFVPYLMDAPHGEKSLATMSTMNTNQVATLTIDLGTSQSIDWIHLHTVEGSDTVPLPFTSGIGVPRHLVIEGANTADFSDAVHLLDLYCPSAYEAGPIIMRRLPEIACRYIRLSARDPYLYTTINGATRARFGFAEVELLSNGQNVALNRPVSANFEMINSARTFAALTDGRNLYGDILPLRDWMNELARRHELEKELPKVTELLNTSYSRQQTHIRLLGWLTALLAAGIGFTILIEKMVRMRQITRIRERFAADLHDELGANLHAIGILGTYAKDVLDSPEKLIRTVNEIKSLTGRTGEATRYCSDMQTAKEDHENLAADLQRTARRIIANLNCDFVIEGEAFLKNIKPRTRADLFLFFKESLININRHADASAVTIRLTANERQVQLSISDDGCGLSGDEDLAIPASLQRRARLMKARVAIENPPTGGTGITLQLRLKKKKNGSR
jgi:signal transduction histidine kinase